MSTIPWPGSLFRMSCSELKVFSRATIHLHQTDSAPMRELDLIKRLSDPNVYPDHPREVSIIQTYISIICLTGTYAYKFKKPVDYGYLDYRTLEKRRFYCEEEIRLNRRFAPDLYLDVLPLTYRSDIDALSLQDGGEPIDYAVKMKEIPQDRIMRTLVLEGKVDLDAIVNIITTLARIYREAPTNARISSYGTIESIRRNTDENFAQTQSLIGITITDHQFSFIRQATEAFYQQYADLFQRRVAEGRIREGHGDLRTANIFLTDEVLVFDCIEFNERLRCIDVAADLAFLAVDLDFLQQTALSARLILWFAWKSKDYDLLKLANFYKCYRAYVRGKVLTFSFRDEALSAAERQQSRADAGVFFSLAESYAKNLTFRYLEFDKPFLIIMSGCSGEGKSYIAGHLKDMLKARLLRSDEVRKELFSHRATGSSDQPCDRGIYSLDNRQRVYDELFQRAAAILSQRNSCIVDATFMTQRLRNRAAAIAQNAYFFIIRPKASYHLVKERLCNRAADSHELSEARWETYQEQTRLFEPFDAEEQEYLLLISADHPRAYEEAYDAFLARMKDHIPVHPGLVARQD